MSAGAEDVDETAVLFAKFPVETVNLLGRKKPAAQQKQGDKKAIGQPVTAGHAKRYVMQLDGRKHPVEEVAG